MKRKFQCLALLACLAAGAGAHAGPARPAKSHAMTKAQYAAEQAKIAADLEATRKLCASLKGHRGEVCETEATGRAEALGAELDARYKPSPKASQKAKNVTAEANYDVAKAKCDALQGKAEDRCMKEAKAAREAAIRQAKVEKVRETGGLFANGSARRVGKGDDS